MKPRLRRRSLAELSSKLPVALVVSMRSPAAKDGDMAWAVKMLSGRRGTAESAPVRGRAAGGEPLNASTTGELIGCELGDGLGDWAERSASRTIRLRTSCT